MKKNIRIKISVLCGVLIMALTSCGSQTSIPVEYQPDNPQYYTVTYDERNSTTTAAATVQTVEKVTAESSTITARTTAKSTRKTTKSTVKSIIKTTSTTKANFEISYWISYAKSYAKGVGLNLNSSATACWDNPITASASSVYLDRDIRSRLNRYSSDPDITDVWIWHEKINQNSYNIYIGYA